MRKIVRIALKMAHTYNWYLHPSTCAYGEMFNSNMKYPKDLAYLFPAKRDPSTSAFYAIATFCTAENSIE